MSSYHEHKHEAYAYANNHNLYPSFHRVLKARKECYPSDDSFSITETSAEVDITQLVHHTYSRICDNRKEFIEALPNSQNISHFSAESKVGSDGTTGLSIYKFVSQQDSADKGCCYISNFVPLKLYAEYKSKQKVLVWKNPKPPSTKFCRPIKLLFQKETSALIENKAEALKNSLSNIPNLKINIDDFAFDIVFKKKKLSFHHD